MKTVSVNVMNLCVPCFNHCRYCLLSYNGHINGANYQRSQNYAERFYKWIQANRPDLSFLFGFGYSMEHPDLLRAIDFCKSIGSATGEFMQLNGMKLRTDTELKSLLSELKTHGIKLINLTFYGTECYHDTFSARSGDFRLMINTIRLANEVGIDVTADIPLTQENTCQIDSLLKQLEPLKIEKIRCFIPHIEGRGMLLGSIRFSEKDYLSLNDNVRSLINRNKFKTEREWLSIGFPTNEKRVLTVTLTADNISFFEEKSFEDTISYLEELDDNYYRVIPSANELAEIYGNKNGDKLYSAYDLYLNYQHMYKKDNKIEIYDVNDERHCFVRRF